MLEKLVLSLLVTSLALRAAIQLDAICQPLVRKACLGDDKKIFRSCLAGAVSIHFLWLISMLLLLRRQLAGPAGRDFISQPHSGKGCVSHL